MASFVPVFLSDSTQASLLLQLHYADVIDEFQNEWHTFGIASVQSNCHLINTETIVLFFSIDNSASMQETCDDGTRKMEQVHQTLKNMLRFLVNIPRDIIIAIDSFDDEIISVIKFEVLSHVNFDAMIRQIDTIQPNGSTNIELALTNARTQLDAYQLANSSHKVVHICLTDGCANKGETNSVALSRLVSDQYANIYIGYGMEHDTRMLQALSAKNGGEYYVITQLELAKEVCGEITHNIVYAALENAHLEVTNGEAYDWRNNEWKAKVYVSGIAGQNKKTVHVRTLTPETILVELKGAISCGDEIQCVNIETPVPRLLDFNGEFTEPTDLTKYMFRQRTQEKLHQALRFNNARATHRILTQVTRYVASDTQDEDLDIFAALKLDIKTFFITMKEYMRFNQLEADVFMKELLDDLYISYKTLGQADGSMHCAGRQTAQGRQDSTRPTLQRQNARMPQVGRTNTICTSFGQDERQDEQDEDYTFIGHEFSQDNSNVNEVMAQVIRAVSSR